MKFHGIYWPAFLIAAGLEPPRRLLVHSHWTVDGEKMSKSKLNIVDPMERATTYTHEGMRYFLLREGTAHSDASKCEDDRKWDIIYSFPSKDYSDTKLLRILNAELADTLGNLLSRGCAKSVNTAQQYPIVNMDYFHNDLMQMDCTRKLVELTDELPGKCYAHYSAYNFYLAADQVMEVLRAANNFFESTKPWELRKNNATVQVDTVLSVTLDTLRVCAIALQPIVPVLSTMILDKLRVPYDSRMWKDLDYVAWQRRRDHLAEERPLCSKSDAIIFRRIRLNSDETTVPAATVVATKRKKKLAAK